MHATGIVGNLLPRPSTARRCITAASAVRELAAASAVRELAETIRAEVRTYSEAYLKTLPILDKAAKSVRSYAVEGVN
jgi:hypothetical protein